MICELMGEELERFCLVVGDSAKADALKTGSRMEPSEWVPRTLHSANKSIPRNGLLYVR